MAELSDTYDQQVAEPQRQRAKVGVREHPPWQASLELRFSERQGKTVLSRRRHHGPLCLQKPFYPEGDRVCHVYPLHPPSGLAGGDELALTIEVGQRSHALLTTPASGRCYRSLGRLCRIEQSLRVRSDSCLEWLPQETLLFGGSAVVMGTSIDLHQTARFVGWEIFALGRPLSGDLYEEGSLDQRFELSIDSRLVLSERLRFTAGGSVLRRPWGLRGMGVCGVLVAYPADRALLEGVRSALEGATTVGVTLVDRLLVVRALGTGVEPLRGALVSALAVIRPSVVHQEFRVPRIWRT